MIDRARLQAVIDPIVSAHGAELCDFELKNENGWVLRIYVERLGSLAPRNCRGESAGYVCDWMEIGLFQR